MTAVPTAKTAVERRLDMPGFSSQFLTALRWLQDRALRIVPTNNFWKIRLDEAKLRHGLVLRENADRYLAIFDTEVDAIVVADRFGIIQSFNRAAETIFGYSSEEAIGRNVRSLMPEPDQSVHDDCLASYRKSGERKIIGFGRGMARYRRPAVLHRDYARRHRS